MGYLIDYDGDMVSLGMEYHQAEESFRDVVHIPKINVLHQELLSPKG